MATSNDIDELKISPNGHDPETETQEQLDSAYKTLSQLRPPNGSALSLGKQELSLLQKMLSVGTENFREEIMWRMMSFVDTNEMQDYVAAYYEAKDLGMDTSFNVAVSFALCSVNRRGAFTSNLIAILGDVLQHGKWAMNQRNGKNGTGQKGSPTGD